jgi:predicted PurR-regulated permease PerM
MDTPEPRQVSPTLITYAALTLSIVLPLAVMLSSYTVSVLTGMILAVLFYPAYARLRRRLPPWAAGLTVTLGAVLLVVVPVILLAIGAWRQGATVLAQISVGDTPKISEIITDLQAWLALTDAFGTPEEIRAILQTGVDRLSAAASSRVFSEVQALPERALQLVLVTLSTYFLLVDGRRLFSWIAEKVPLSRHIREALVASFRGATTAVVLASVVASGAQALLLLLGCWALGVPAALLAGGAGFILAWIPTVGTVPVWGAAASYLYLQGSPSKAAVMVGIGLLVGIVDNVVRPLVLQGREAMHPMVSLLAIIGGLSLVGLPGVFIGPLLASMAISVLEIWPAVASYCGIPVSGAGDDVPDVPMLDNRRG